MRNHKLLRLGIATFAVAALGAVPAFTAQADTNVAEQPNTASKPPMLGDWVKTEELVGLKPTTPITSPTGKSADSNKTETQVPEYDGETISKQVENAETNGILEKPGSPSSKILANVTDEAKEREAREAEIKAKYDVDPTNREPEPGVLFPAPKPADIIPDSYEHRKKEAEDYTYSMGVAPSKEMFNSMRSEANKKLYAVNGIDIEKIINTPIPNSPGAKAAVVDLSERYYLLSPHYMDAELVKKYGYTHLAEIDDSIKYSSMQGIYSKWYDDPIRPYSGKIIAPNFEGYTFSHVVKEAGTPDMNPHPEVIEANYDAAFALRGSGYKNGKGDNIFDYYFIYNKDEIAKEISKPEENNTNPAEGTISEPAETLQPEVKPAEEVSPESEPETNPAESQPADTSEGHANSNEVGDSSEEKNESNTLFNNHVNKVKEVRIGYRFRKFTHRGGWVWHYTPNDEGYDSTSEKYPSTTIKLHPGESYTLPTPPTIAGYVFESMSQSGMNPGDTINYDNAPTSTGASSHGYHISYLYRKATEHANDQKIDPILIGAQVGEDGYHELDDKFPEKYIELLAGESYTLPNVEIDGYRLEKIINTGPDGNELSYKVGDVIHYRNNAGDDLDRGPYFSYVYEKVQSGSSNQSGNKPIEKPSDQPQPTKPVKPAEEPSVTPVVPVSPTTPVKPISPVTPVVPTVPTTPVTPTNPATPSTSRVLSNEAGSVQVRGSEATLKNVSYIKVEETKAKSLETKSYKAYDIHLYDANGKAIQPNGMVLVTLSADKPVENVYYVAPDGALQALDFKQDADKVTFETNHFSIYAMTFKNVAANRNDSSIQMPIAVVGGENTTTTAQNSNGADATKAQATPLNTKTEGGSKALPNTGEQNSILGFAGFLLASLGLAGLTYKGRH
ncbi:LPXTG cell wall anchor domain-containing protein [Streptococcus oralis]|uniref:IgA FC receptor n=1 Tax=Streptococcus oralis TaxID=1303 RepID=A0A3R9J254_STROR|nr:LPXTG cell wall anchor domain-containing protein [Streptococcus oralis]RSI66212.1 IgA FC receptor precursor [Streptococcus oralis]